MYFYKAAVCSQAISSIVLKNCPHEMKVRVDLNYCCLFSISSTSSFYSLFCSLRVCAVCFEWVFRFSESVWYCERKQRWTRSCTSLWRGPTPAWSSVTPAHLRMRMAQTFIINTTESRTSVQITSLTAGSPTTATKSEGNPWSCQRKVWPKPF